VCGSGVDVQRCALYDGLSSDHLFSDMRRDWVRSGRERMSCVRMRQQRSRNDDDNDDDEDDNEDGCSDRHVVRAGGLCFSVSREV